MKVLNFSNIPLNYLDVAKQILNLDVVKEEIEFMQRLDIEDPVVELEAVHDGYTLVSIPHADVWLLRLPDGIWRRAYIGHGEVYAKTVLEDKYKCLDVFKAHISSFGEIHPVYI
ncbi:hypothetical protein M5F04_01600 [Acinetobacter sp. ANC 7200]|uniref:hypothetical protein n=1 Tax=Acinetobacter amyesii TaxID=2942470 RepID=UPI0020BD545B|nr:hypothetical protein [Acinetobacter amyesii]MCL6243271.1 hypothetical protein [Acinetobacter amyesii]